MSAVITLGAIYIYAITLGAIYIHKSAAKASIQIKGRNRAENCRPGIDE